MNVAIIIADGSVPCMREYTPKQIISMHDNSILKKCGKVHYEECERVKKAYE